MNASLSRSQLLSAAAAACGLFVLTLFVPWFGSGSAEITGEEALPSYWLFLLFAIAAGVLLMSESLGFEMPAWFRTAPHGAMVAAFPFVMTLALFLEGGGLDRRLGLFAALALSGLAVVLPVLAWRAESQSARASARVR